MVDATILLTVQPIAAVGNAQETEESLYPARHQMTLPLHGLNVLFSDCIVAFNHHTKLDSDRLLITSIYIYNFFREVGGNTVAILFLLLLFIGISFWILIPMDIFHLLNKISILHVKM